MYDGVFVLVGVLVWVAVGVVVGVEVEVFVGVTAWGDAGAMPAVT